MKNILILFFAIPFLSQISFAKSFKDYSGQYKIESMTCWSNGAKDNCPALYEFPSGSDKLLEVDVNDGFTISSAPNDSDWQSTGWDAIPTTHQETAQNGDVYKLNGQYLQFGDLSEMRIVETIGYYGVVFEKWTMSPLPGVRRFRLTLDYEGTFADGSNSAVYRRVYVVKK